MSRGQRTQRIVAPRGDRRSAVGLVAPLGILVALASIVVPAWLLIGPASQHARTPIAGVVNACQEGVRRGQLGVVGFVAAGVLLVWGVSVVATVLLVGFRTGLSATQASRALAGMSREVEVFADGRAVVVRVLPHESGEAFTAGLLRPRIYLGTRVIRCLAPLELEAVVIHELAHVRRRDPLRCWLVQTIGASLWWPGTRSVAATHRAIREAGADEYTIARMGDHAPLLKALLRVDAVPAEAGLNPLTSERRRALRALREAPDESVGFPSRALWSGVALFGVLLAGALLGLSDWQTFWLCPDGTTTSM